MTILVTGGAGYIGSHTILELLKNNHDIVVLDNFSNSSIVSLERVGDLVGKNIKIIEGDVRCSKTLEFIFKQYSISSVIHFAGLKSVSESINEPLKYYDNNVYGSIQLLKYMKRFNVKNIVFSSSATVYGNPKSLPIREDAPTTKPENPYGSSKLIVEGILKDWFKSDNSISITILRYFNPVGAHQSGKIGEDPNGIPNNLMPLICQTALGINKKLKIYGDDYDTFDGTGVRDYIHVCDLARGHLEALEHFLDKPSLNIYNLGTGEGTSVQQLINVFENVNGMKIKTLKTSRRSGDVPACYADVTKIKRDIGWEASYGLNEMCQDSWLWQKNNPKGYKS
jgi:UDP-glucose 4-epimerase